MPDLLFEALVAAARPVLGPGVSLSVDARLLGHRVAILTEHSEIILFSSGDARTRGLRPHGAEAARLALAEPVWGAVVRKSPPAPDVEPALGSTVGTPRPFLVARFNARLRHESARIRLDGIEVTGEARIRRKSVSYLPTQDLAAGLHTVRVQALAVSGRLLSRDWSFWIGSSAPCEWHSLGVHSPL